MIYIEACESGSIFQGLLSDSLNIYATTASNAQESSWGTYCPGMVPAPPEEFNTCLGDLYSVAFLENRWRPECGGRAQAACPLQTPLPHGCFGWKAGPLMMYYRCKKQVSAGAEAPSLIPAHMADAHEAGLELLMMSGVARLVCCHRGNCDLSSVCAWPPQLCTAGATTRPCPRVSATEIHSCALLMQRASRPDRGDPGEAV